MRNIPAEYVFAMKLVILSNEMRIIHNNLQALKAYAILTTISFCRLCGLYALWCHLIADQVYDVIIMVLNSFLRVTNIDPLRLRL